MQSAGIDDIEVYTPELYVDATNFENARGMEPGHMFHGVGIHKMSIPDSCDDAMTMGTMAALKLIEKNNLSPSEVGRIDVATESSLDESKGANSYIIGMLEQVLGKGTLTHAGGVEKKFACASGGYATYDQVNWIRSDEHDGKLGIIIMTDIARYDLLSSGEYTQGAGAVAYLIAESPRLINLEPKVTSFFVDNERDFFRPFGRSTAVVDGHYSNLCYLYAMRTAMVRWQEASRKAGTINPKDGEAFLDYVDQLVFHIPYPRIAEHAAAFLFRHEWRKLPRWKEIVSGVGLEPMRDEPGSIDAILNDEEYMESDKQFRKKFVKTPMFKQEFETKIESSLIASREIGNVYSASLPLGLYGLFENMYKSHNDLEGNRIGLGYYGSGCTALVTSGIVQEGYNDVTDKFDLMKRLDSRREISMSEYEDLHEGRLSLDNPIISPSGKFVLSDIGKSGNTEGYRYYKFVE